MTRRHEQDDMAHFFMQSWINCLSHSNTPRESWGMMLFMLTILNMSLKGMVVPCAFAGELHANIDRLRDSEE